MTPVPLDLPLRPAEAVELANLIFDHAERKVLNDDVRNRLAARAAVLRLSTIAPYFGSLGRDPVHPSVYYLAVDVEDGSPQLLHIALANAPTSSIFQKPLLIGRMRRHNGPEIVINAIPFDAADHENLEKFATLIDTGFLPRPQGARTTIAVADDPPAAFAAFRGILKRTGRNVASLTGGYYAGLWAAIRAGWRQEYTVGLDVPVTAAAFESAREMVRNAAGYSRFAADGSSLQREPANGTALDEQFEASFTVEERGWIRDEFTRRFDAGNAIYQLSPQEVVWLAVKFAGFLKTIEQLREQIRQTRSLQKVARPFDFQLSLPSGPNLTTPRELMFCLHWLKARGHAVQLAAPNLGFVDAQPYAVEGVHELSDRVKALAAVARCYQATLSVRHGSGKQPEVVEAIAKAALGRVNYQVSSAAEVHSVAEQLLG